MSEALAPPDVRRADALRRFGAADADLDALLAYTASPFDLSGPERLDDEPFVAAWQGYLDAAAPRGVFPVLQQALVQLRFPVREGLRETATYQAATRQGDLSALGTDGRLDGGLRLAEPDALRLELHPTPAGRIPVLTAPVRSDFEALVHALTRRNDPVPLPASMGALMVSGYTNWDRVARYREQWADGRVDAPTWSDAFRQLVPQKDLYQDRFILLSEGPYSGVPAARLGLEEDAWIRLSHVIRREHECAHYYCRRALGAMRTNAFDEFIADAAGVLAAGAPDPAAWMATFLTDEETGRVGSYLPGLSPAQGDVVRRLLAAVIDAEDWRRLATLARPGGSSAALLRDLAAAPLDARLT